MRKRALQAGVALKKRDMVKEALAKHHVEEEADVEQFKDILALLKDARAGKEVVVPKRALKKPAPTAEAKDDGTEKAAAEAADEGGEGQEEPAEVEAEEEPLRKRREGAIHFKLFMKVAELALCSQAQEGSDAAHCVNLHMVDREVHEALDAKQQGRKDTFKRDGNYKRPQDG